MKPEVIDVTGLSPEQIAILQEIVVAFRAVSQQQEVNQTVSDSGDEEQLEQLHREFDWWVADVGVKQSINRSTIYGIESGLINSSFNLKHSLSKQQIQ